MAVHSYDHVIVGAGSGNMLPTGAFAGWRIAVVESERVNKNAAWYYPHSSPLARKIRNHVAFWNGGQLNARTAQAQEAPEAGISAGPEAACEPGMPPGAEA